MKAKSLSCHQREFKHFYTFSIERFAKKTGGNCVATDCKSPRNIGYLSLIKVSQDGFLEPSAQRQQKSFAKGAHHPFLSKDGLSSPFQQAQFDASVGGPYLVVSVAKINMLQYAQL